MEEAHVLAAQVRSDLATAQPEIGFDEFLSRRRGRISSTSNERLARYVSEVIARLRPIEPAKIILFGSFATGSPTETSDLDLLVVTKSDRLPATYREKEAVYLEVVRLIRDIKQEISIDLIVHTQPMHARFIAMNSLFAREVLQKGVVLYESHHA